MVASYANDIEVIEPVSDAIRQEEIINPDVVVHEDQNISRASVDSEVIELAETRLILEYNRMAESLIRFKSA